MSGLLLSEHSVQTSHGYHTFLSLHLPAIFTTSDSVQLLSFNLLCSFILAYSLIDDFCASGQRFARRVSTFPTSDFLQIPPRDGHPGLRLYPSHCRSDSGFSPVRNVRRRAHKRSTRQIRPRCFLPVRPKQSGKIFDSILPALNTSTSRISPAVQGH